MSAEVRKAQGSETPKGVDAPDVGFVEVYLSDMEAAAIIGNSVPSIWRWRKQGKLEFVKLSDGCSRCKLSSVMALTGRTPSKEEVAKEAFAIMRQRMDDMRRERSVRWKRQEEKRRRAEGGAAA